MAPQAIFRALILFVVLTYNPLLGCVENKQAPSESVQKKVPALVVDEGCPHSKGGTCMHEGTSEKGEKAKEGGDPTRLYGEALGDSPQLSISQLLASPEEFHGKTVQVTGHVRRVCARRGCWMEIAGDASDDSPSCRVTFKDYGFLVPVDSKGSSVKLQGVVQLTKVKKAAVDHYESEGASFESKGADGSAKEIRLIATGVELKRI